MRNGACYSSLTRLKLGSAVPAVSLAFRRALRTLIERYVCFPARGSHSGHPHTFQDSGMWIARISRGNHGRYRGRRPRKRISLLHYARIRSTGRICRFVNPRRDCERGSPVESQSARRIHSGQTSRGGSSKPKSVLTVDGKDLSMHRRCARTRLADWRGDHRSR